MINTSLFSYGTMGNHLGLSNCDRNGEVTVQILCQIMLYVELTIVTFIILKFSKVH